MEWVNVKDRKPKEKGPYLVVNYRANREDSWAAIYDSVNDIWRGAYKNNNEPPIDVTHWLQIPKLQMDHFEMKIEK